LVQILHVHGDIVGDITFSTASFAADNGTNFDSGPSGLGRTLAAALEDEVADKVEDFGLKYKQRDITSKTQ